MSLPGGERPWERGWSMEKLQLDKFLYFPCGHFLNLGGWFPVANYPFSETRFGQMTVVNSDGDGDESFQVTTFLFLVTIHECDTRTAFAIRTGVRRFHRISL